MAAADLLIVFLVDFVAGAPRWFPHPVRYIGTAIHGMERWTRRVLGDGQTAGIVTVAAAVAGTGLVVWLTLWSAAQFSPVAARVLGILWCALGLSARSMATEATAVGSDLARNDLGAAQQSVSRIVGRDTADLDEAGVSRAAIESVAESTVDGVIAPLFWAALGGPVALWVFKAVSTCDSMIGHRSERYERFGTLGARLDDVFNWGPARLGFALFPLGAVLCGGAPVRAWVIAWRDHGRHDSPNSGIGESAMAGALGVQLGGPLSYGGRSAGNGPFGEGLPVPTAADIRRALDLMWSVALLAVLLSAGLAALINRFIMGW